VRLNHALGQSLPDWLRLRYGRIEAAPDGVAFPESADEVRELLRYARDAARGGALRRRHQRGRPPGRGARPAHAVGRHARLRAMHGLDRESQLATFGAGVFGPDLEAQLRAHGYTLGHFPQSFEYSTLGGWVVTRSSGQQSLRYGRIEQLFAGGRMETPAGTLEIPTFPASAAGTDLRELVLGSEGRLGILTEATVRISRCRNSKPSTPCSSPTGSARSGRARDRAGAPAAVDAAPVEPGGDGDHADAGRPQGGRSALLETLLRLRGAGEGKCMLLVGASGAGERRQARAALAACALKIARRHGGVHAGRGLGERWKKNRFRNVYLRNAAWAHGYAIDTVETALDWPRVTPAMRAVEAAAGAWRRTASRCTPTPTCRTCMRRAPACTRPSSGAWPATTTPTWRAGAASRRGVGSDRRQRRHHQPPARRRHRPRALAARGEGRAGHGGAARAVPPVRSGRLHESRQAGGAVMNALWRRDGRARCPA
jgi:alkyldihydroxyacetonephosphate synthase